MLKKIKRFFSHTERNRRRRARQAAKDREELSSLLEIRGALDDREKHLVKRLERHYSHDVAYDLLDRRARGW